MLEPYWSVDYGYHHSHRQQFEYLGLAQLSNRLAFIHDSQLKIHQGLIDQDVALIRNCAKQTGRLPVLTLDSNPYDVDLYCAKLDQYLDRSEYFVFHSDIRAEQSTQLNQAPWPSWLLFQHHTPDCQLFDKTRRISFLSGIPRQHRIELFRTIKPLVRDNDVVVVNRFQSADSSIPPEWLEELPWANHSCYIDTPQTEYNAFSQESNSHPAYNACVNITGETLGYGSQILPSEKTWKAYRSGCLVVNYGVAGMTTTLEKFGLWIWKDYDVDLEAGPKIQKCVELFERDDIFEIYQNNKSMIQYNRNLVMSKEFVHSLAAMAKEKIQCLIK